MERNGQLTGSWRSAAVVVSPIAGPRIYDMADLVRGYLLATGKRRPIVRVPTPGKAAAAIRAGANLAPEHAVGVRTWEAFLAERSDPHGARSLTVPT